MRPLHLVLHGLNFAAPALFVALAMVAANRLFWRQAPWRAVWWVQGAIHFSVGLAALLAGLIYFGSDARMLTYLALVLSCATSQWLLARGWKH